MIVAVIAPVGENYCSLFQSSLVISLSSIRNNNTCTVHIWFYILHYDDFPSKIIHSLKLRVRNPTEILLNESDRKPQTATTSTSTNMHPIKQHQTTNTALSCNSSKVPSEANRIDWWARTKWNKKSICRIKKKSERERERERENIHIFPDTVLYGPFIFHHRS